VAKSEVFRGFFEIITPNYQIWEPQKKSKGLGRGSFAIFQNERTFIQAKGLKMSIFFKDGYFLPTKI
jgi:hypothetical protein